MDSAKGDADVAHSHSDHRPGGVLDADLARLLSWYSRLARRESAQVALDHWLGCGRGAAAWLVRAFLLGAPNVFPNDVLPPRVPMALFWTPLPGHLLVPSPT